VATFARRTRPLVLLMVGLAGCSLGNTDVGECESTAQCRTAFGFGSVCSAEGFCEAAPVESRCASTFPPDLFDSPTEHADRIVFGNLMDRSLATHRARELSARLALKQANGEGGIAGRPLGLVFCTVEEDLEFDELSRMDAAVYTARYLVNTLELPGLIGPASSDDVQAVFLDLADRDIVIVSPSATSPALTPLDPEQVDDDNPGRLWRTAPPDSLQGAAIAFDMREPGAGREAVVDEVAVIHAVGAYGEALSAVFAEEFTRLGGTATLTAFANENERDEAIATAATSGVDEVLFVSSQTEDSIDFMNAAAVNGGFDGKRIFLPDAAANSDLLQRADPARFPVVRGTRQAPRDPAEDLVYGQFVGAYAGEYGENVNQFSFTANAFDAAWLLAYGAAWALQQEGGLSGGGIARGLRRVSAGTSLDVVPSSWLPVLDEFREGVSVNLNGASGDLDFDPATEETSGRIQTWRIDDEGGITGIGVWPPE